MEYFKIGVIGKFQKNEKQPMDMHCVEFFKESLDWGWIKKNQSLNFWI